MPFLEVEGDQLANLDLMDMVEMKHSRRVASLWAGGVLRHADSPIAYSYFMQNQDQIVRHVTVTCSKCGRTGNTHADLLNHECVPPAPKE